MEFLYGILKNEEYFSRAIYFKMAFLNFSEKKCAKYSEKPDEFYINKYFIGFFLLRKNASKNMCIFHCKIKTFTYNLFLKSLFLLRTKMVNFNLGKNLAKN